MQDASACAFVQCSKRLRNPKKLYKKVQYGNSRKIKNTACPWHRLKKKLNACTKLREDNMCVHNLVMLRVQTMPFCTFLHTVLQGSGGVLRTAQMRIQMRPAFRGSPQVKSIISTLLLSFKEKSERA